MWVPWTVSTQCHFQRNPFFHRIRPPHPTSAVFLVMAKTVLTSKAFLRKIQSTVACQVFCKVCQITRSSILTDWQSWILFCCPALARVMLVVLGAVWVLLVVELWSWKMFFHLTHPWLLSRNVPKIYSPIYSRNVRVQANYFWKGICSHYVKIMHPSHAPFKNKGFTWQTW